MFRLTTTAGLTLIVTAIPASLARANFGLVRDASFTIEESTRHPAAHTRPPYKTGIVRSF